MRRFLGHPLFGLITGAGVIRLLGVFARGIQYDDAFSILLAGTTFDEIIAGTAADTMPPLYYFILHLWQIFGSSIAFLRLPGIIFSLGIIFLAYHVVEKAAGRQAAIWTAAILAVNPLQYYHAQDIRMYSLATFLIMVWIWAAMELFLEKDLQKFPVWKWCVLCLSGAGALYSHALAGFGLLSPYVFFLLKRDWKHLWGMIAAGVVSLSLYIPWLTLVPGQIAKVQRAFWTPVPGVVEVFQSIIMVFGDIPAPPIAMGISLFSAVLIAVICGISLVRNRNENGSLLMFFLMAVIPPACLFILSYIMRPMFVPRAFLSAYVGLAACLGVVSSRSRIIEKCLIGGLISICALATLPSSIQYNEFPRSPFLAASTYLESAVRQGDVILHDNKLSFFPSKVYSPRLNSQFLMDIPGSANDTLAAQTMRSLDIKAYEDVGTAIRGYDRVFFIVFQQTIDEFTALGEVHPVLEELDELADKPVEHKFGDLLVFEYSMGTY